MTVVWIRRITTSIALLIVPILFNNCDRPFGVVTSLQLKGPVQLTNSFFDSDDKTKGEPLESQFSCSAPLEVDGSTTNYILSRKQYLNTIEDMFGSEAVGAISAQISLLPIDNYDLETQRRTNSFELDQAEVYFRTAKALADFVLKTSELRNKVFVGCESGLTPNCINKYLDGFAVRILRRPLNQDERQFALQALNGSGNATEKLRMILLAQLMSPHFIWLLELGKSEQADDKKIELTDYELASRLSYSLADSPPTSELLALAGSGQLSSPATIKLEVQRLIESPRGQNKLIAALQRWSRSDFALDLDSLPEELIGGIKLEGLRNAMLDEAKEFIRHTLYSKRGTFNQLLTSKASFASHEGLAAIYGHSPIQGREPAEFTDRRRGLLMRAPYFTTLDTRAGIILRGVDFYTRVLCGEMPSPNVDIAEGRNEVMFSHEEKLFKTNRDIVAHQTRSPVCMSCHSVINPIGFAFENFDSLGRFRSQEKIFDDSGKFIRALSIDTSGDVPLPHGGVVSIKDGYDLVGYVAESAEGNECFIRGLYRYVHEKKEEAADSCKMEEAFQSIANKQMPVVDAYAQMMAHPSIRYKFISEAN